MEAEIQVGAGSRAHVLNKIEWPTLALALGVYLLFGVLTWLHAALPWWLILPLGAYLVCLHGSLQHEAVHGHPTPWSWANEALVFPSLWFWMPYRSYRRIHLQHHRNELLTDPTEDPESAYLAPDDWAKAGTLRRGLLTVNNSLAGRLLIGPFIAIWHFLAGEIPAFLAGDRERATDWAMHAAGSATALAWIVGVCGIPVGEYLLLYALPGMSLTLLRSFLEHQARAEVDQRSVLIEAGPVMSLLYLNNNLHAVHHEEPGTPWYRLPGRYRELRETLLARNGGYRYRSYLEIFGKYLLRPKEPVAHPGL